MEIRVSSGHVIIIDDNQQHLSEMRWAAAPFF